MRALILATVIATALASSAVAGELNGPGRFCGYAPIIDLAPGEKITTLSGGIHSGKFRWEGDFGALEVSGIGWAARPGGRIEEPAMGSRPARFAQRRVDGGYVIAIWNGSHGAAYFRSPSRLTNAQIRAIRRVTLYEEAETPEGCDLRMMFVWE